MGLTLLNTLTRTLEPFEPAGPDKRMVRMYCCGPTVHNYAHIGNFRTFVFADLVRRYLAFRGYAVEHVMNVTDVEDKIIASARAAGVSIREHTARYESAFFEDFDSLHCLRPKHLPHATEFIPEIIQLIERLVARGLAYVAPDRSVYFSIAQYQAQGFRYGQLLNLSLDKMRAGERVKSDEYDKESVADFALWKARVAEDGDVSWDSPWGAGRPGWHIECSAMSMKVLSPSFDLHLGGEDLIFPHHEDEIAQSEGARLQPPGSRFVRCWLHGAHLLVEGKKMSKSLGNFYTLRDLYAQGFTGREVRYLLLTSHYREPFNFTLDGLHGARAALARIDECLSRLADIAGPARSAADPILLAAFTEVMDKDLNVAAAWGLVFDWIRETNRLLAASAVTPERAAASLEVWNVINSVFGITSPTDPLGAPTARSGIPPEIETLLEQRESARRAKDFRRADALRDELKEKGWVIEDTPKGPRLKRLKP